MKLYVSAKLGESIKGYHQIPIVYGNWDVDGVPDNSAISIVVNHGVDNIPTENEDKFLSDMSSKMRRGGSLTLIGTDLHEFARAVYVRELNSESANSILNGLTSLRTGKELCKKLKGLGLTVTSYLTKGLNYEISATR